MNYQEREQISRFLTQLAQAQAGSKDAEAEKLILAAASRQPDALYLLVQRSLLLEQALENAQSEIRRLQQQQQESTRPSGSFLSGNTWGNTPAQQPVQAQGVPGPASTAAWGSGMLGNIATTAAGVVAGSFLFQGIEHLMGNHNASGFLQGSNPHETVSPHENLLDKQSADSSQAHTDFADIGPAESDPDWM